MGPFLDFLPIVAWFIAYRLYGMYVATVVIMVAMAALIAFQWFRTGKVSKMLLISGALLAVLGGITLAVGNPVYFQWKVTVANWLFAAAFLGSAYVGEKTVVERIMGHAVELDRVTWRQLNWIWVVSFLVMGALNLYVLYNFDLDTWAKFKLYGTIGFSVVTLVASVILISARSSHTPESPDEAGKGS